MQDDGAQGNAGNGAGGNGAAPSATGEDGQAARPPMPLFYLAPEPLNEQRFGGKGVRKAGDFRFAAKAHAMPLHLQEFRFAAAHYPIIFSDDESATPLAIMGLSEGRNLFIDAEGRWKEGTYVPAYARRYPFVTGQGPNPGEQLLYLDAGSDMVVDLAQAPDADPLFEHGGPAPRTKEALDLCSAFQQQAPLTQAFLEALLKHELLEGKEVRLDLPGGKQQVLTGLRLIDEAKFNALPDEVFLEWRKHGWLAAAYWHWASMDNLHRYTRMG